MSAPFLSDVEAAIALLQRVADGADQNLRAELSKKAGTEIGLLAAEAKRLIAFTPSELLWENAGEARFYNEVRTKAHVRPAYAKVVEALDRIMMTDPGRISNFAEQSLKDFRGDNRLYHMPRMLTKAESNTLVKGIAQRAQAIRRLVLDMNSSSNSDEMACVKSGSLPRGVLGRVAARAAEMPNRELVQESLPAPELYWNIWYGADIIRGPDAQFYVLEDNLGYVGMFGDLVEARRVLLKSFKELEPAIGDDHTADFYKEMGEHYKTLVKPGEKIVVLHYMKTSSKGGGEWECDDNEDKRMVQLLKRHCPGIIAVPIAGHSGPRKDRPWLEVRDKKVFVLTPKKSRAKKMTPSPLTPGRDLDLPLFEKAEEFLTSGNVISHPEAEQLWEFAKVDGSVAGLKRETLEHMLRKLKFTAKAELFLKGKLKVDQGDGDEPEEPQQKKQKTSTTPEKQKVSITPVEILKEEPVGLVILLSEAQNVDPQNESVRVRAAIEDANTRIGEYKEAAAEARLDAKGAEKSIERVIGKWDVTDKDEQKHSFQMKNKQLVWIAYSKEDGQKEAARIKGPLAWNETKSTISGTLEGQKKPWSIRLKDDDVKTAKKEKLKINDEPVKALKAMASAEQLRLAAEKVGQPIGGEMDKVAIKDLEKLLQRDDGNRWKQTYQKGVPNLLEAYYAGGVKIVNGPGFEQIGDKELCCYIDELVKHYLGEEPILRTAPTRSFAETGIVNAVFGNRHSKSNVVVKRVDGRGGTGVWVGKKIDTSEFQEARSQVEAEPESFIAQKYMTLSQTDGQIVDLRGPSFITSADVELSGGTGVAVSPVLVGRGSIAKGGNGKVNISDNGFEFTVATCPD